MSFCKYSSILTTITSTNHQDTRLLNSVTQDSDQEDLEELCAAGGNPIHNHSHRLRVCYVLSTQVTNCTAWPQKEMERKAKKGNLGAEESTIEFLTSHNCYIFFSSILQSYACR